MNRDMNTYIGFLNNTDWSVFHWSQPATWSDPFWQSNQISWDIADILSGDVTTSDSSWLDVYDPAFEQDLNTFTDASATGTEDFWFTTSGQTVSDQTPPSETISKAELLRQRKLAQ